MYLEIFPLKTGRNLCFKKLQNKYKTMQNITISFISVEAVHVLLYDINVNTFIDQELPNPG